MKFVFRRVVNIEGIGENAGCLFPIMFSKGFFLGVVKSCDCVGMVEKSFDHIHFLLTLPQTSPGFYVSAV